MTKLEPKKSGLTPWQEMTAAQNDLWQSLTDYDLAKGKAAAAEQDDVTPSAEIFALHDQVKAARAIYRRCLAAVESMSEKFDKWNYRNLESLQRDRQKSLGETRNQIAILEAEILALKQKAADTEGSISRHAEELADVRNFLPFQWISGTPQEILNRLRDNPRHRIDYKALTGRLRDAENIELTQAPYKTACTGARLLWDNISGIIVGFDITRTAASDARSFAKFPAEPLGRTSTPYGVSADNLWLECKHRSQERYPRLYREILEKCLGKKGADAEAQPAPEPVEAVVPPTVEEAVQKRLEKELSRA
jgi:hypothetical protein